jgi:hypothetical protein
MTRYATIDAQSGYVWWVGAADSPADACTRSTKETVGDGAQYESCSSSDAAVSYFVHEVAADFDVEDGQSQTEIEATEAFPLVGAFRRIEAEDSST